MLLRDLQLGSFPKHGQVGKQAQGSLSSVAGSLRLPARICRLCGSHSHPFPLTAPQTIEEPPSPSSCLWGRSSCLVMILVLWLGLIQGT